LTTIDHRRPVISVGVSQSKPMENRGILEKSKKNRFFCDFDLKSL